MMNNLVYLSKTKVGKLLINFIKLRFLLTAVFYLLLLFLKLWYILETTTFKPGAVFSFSRFKKQFVPEGLKFNRI